MNIEENMDQIDNALNVFNPDKIEYIYGGVTQQPISRKWQQQAELRQPSEFDFTWEPPNKDSVVTNIILLDRSISLDDYKNNIEYIVSYLINRLFTIFGKKCVNPPFLYQFNQINYGNVYQFYIFYKRSI